MRAGFAVASTFADSGTQCPMGLLARRRGRRRTLSAASASAWARKGPYFADIGRQDEESIKNTLCGDSSEAPPFGIVETGTLAIES